MEQEIIVCSVVALVGIFAFGLGRLCAIASALEEAVSALDEYGSRMNRHLNSIARCFVNAELQNRAAKREAKPAFYSPQIHRQS